MSRSETCGTCKWWSAEHDAFKGMCIAMPPTVIRDPARAKLIAASPYVGRDRPACSLWGTKGENEDDDTHGWGWWK